MEPFLASRGGLRSTIETYHLFDWLFPDGIRSYKQKTDFIYKIRKLFSDVFHVNKRKIMNNVFDSVHWDDRSKFYMTIDSAESIIINRTIYLNKVCYNAFDIVFNQDLSVTAQFIDGNDNVEERVKWVRRTVVESLARDKEKALFEYSCGSESSLIVSWIFVFYYFHLIDLDYQIERAMFACQRDSFYSGLERRTEHWQQSYAKTASMIEPYIQHLYPNYKKPNFSAFLGFEENFRESYPKSYIVVLRFLLKRNYDIYLPEETIEFFCDNFSELLRWDEKAIENEAYVQSVWEEYSDDIMSGRRIPKDVSEMFQANRDYRNYNGIAIVKQREKWQKIIDKHG